MGVSHEQELADGLAKIEKNKKKINRTFYEGGMDDPNVFTKPRQDSLFQRVLRRLGIK